MFKFISLLFLVIAFHDCHGDDVTDGTELVLTFLVHRHGDRTPISTSLSYSTDEEALEASIEKYGAGQLTEVGKRTGYKLGQFLRSRYDELLSPQYNRSEIYIRATDSTRTKMTVLAAMAAVYPALDDNWSEDINWTPVPYTTVPAKYDFNLSELNCPNFITFYYSQFLTSSAKMDAYTDVLKEWSEIIGFNLTAMPVMAYSIHDSYESQISLGISLDSEIEAIYPEIEEAAGAAIDVIFGDDDYVALQVGPLLNEFFTYASEVIAGNDTQKVRVYSAHDYNVYSFMAATQITPRQGVPKYGSMYSLELRKVVETGKYVVLPVYLTSPNDGGEVIYLQVDGCDDLLCDVDQFRNITSAYVLDEDDWRTECGFTDDLVIDDSSIA